MEFNQALDNVREAAKLNIIASQLPRLQRQPDVVVTYEPGDFVLWNPRRDTGSIGLRKNKLEPTNLGPYEVVRHETSVDGHSNTVVIRDLNDATKTTPVHASTLRIFIGTRDEAKALARIDKLELPITRVLAIQGNTRNRDTITATVEFEDSSIEEMPYTIAMNTEAFTEFCEKRIIGRELAMTRNELQQFTDEQRPKGNESIASKMKTWPLKDRIELKERRYITAHYWNTTQWHIHQNKDILPVEVRNYEPLMECIVEAITPKHIDVEIPLFAKTSGKRLKKYVIALTLPQILLYTARESELREMTMIISRDMLNRCTLRDEIHRGARFWEPRHYQDANELKLNWNR